MLSLTTDYKKYISQYLNECFVDFKNVCHDLSAFKSTDEIKSLDLFY